jgi:hypothetical protein
VSRIRGIGGRYRLCDLHVATPVVELDGALQRFCQKCSKWQPLAAFEGEARTCAAQLEAARRRRTVAARRRRAAAAAAAPVAVAPPAAAARRARAKPPAAPPAAAAGSSAAAAGPASASVDDAHALEAYDLEAWLSGEAGGLMDSLLDDQLSGADDEAAAAAAARAAFAAAVARGPIAPLSSCGDTSTVDAHAHAHGGSRGSLSHVSASVKLYDTAPHELPSSMLPDFGRWLSDYFRTDTDATSAAPPALCGVIQPGCTLLTVDALVPSSCAAARGAGGAGASGAGAGAAHALAACLLSGADAPFWRAQAFDVRVAGQTGGVAVQRGGALRALPDAARSAGADMAALPLLRPAALLSTRRGALRSDAPAATSGPLRVRLHGQLLRDLPDAIAGARLSLTLPPTHADGCLLLDIDAGADADADADADAHPPAGAAAPPRAALLCADAAIVAEVCTLDGRGADALLAATSESRDDVLYGLGAALRRGARRHVIAAAAAGAMRRGWAATAARLLAALLDAAEDSEADDDDPDVDADDIDIAPVPAAPPARRAPADAIAAAAPGDATLLHVAVASGRPRMVQLVLNAAAAAGALADADDADDAEAHAGGFAAAASALGTPLSRGAAGAALTPLHVAAMRLAAAPSGSAAARDAAAVASLLVHASGEAALAWFSDPAPAAAAAGATSAALAGATGAPLTARLCVHVRRVAAAMAAARARAAADPSSSSSVSLAAELRRLLRAPPPAPPPSRRAAAAAALRRPLTSLRSALGYDDPSERAAFEAHAAAASVKSMQAFLVLVLSYLVATKMARDAFLPYPRLSREYLLEHCVGGTRQLVLEDFRQTYYRETNAWLRAPTTAAMCALTLPVARIRALYVRRHTALLGTFWVIQFVVCQVYLERLVRSLYDLPTPLVWGCGGNLLQLKVTVLCALVPMRAAPLCALLIARAGLPFIAPYGRIWFLMGPCADGWLPAAPTNAALTLALCSLVVWNERRTLRSFREWRAGEAARTAARRSADKKLE